MIIIGVYDAILYLLCGIVTVLTITQLIMIMVLKQKKGDKK